MCTIFINACNSNVWICGTILYISQGLIKCRWIANCGSFDNFVVFGIFKHFTVCPEKKVKRMYKFFRSMVLKAVAKMDCVLRREAVQLVENFSAFRSDAWLPSSC